ncbi:MAG: hypothetical protein SCK57_04390 [Bacillota bacterium]|nr:hypothetical protein [Bacillota bacterium]MDW7676880.1 hypothetical protein [Bacillota bacterium]
MPNPSQSNQPFKSHQTSRESGSKGNTSQKAAPQKGLKVIGNPLMNTFIMSNVPANLKSQRYPFQAALGFMGIILIFFSFRLPAAFFVGALMLFLRHQWRKKTDEAAVDYRNAVVSLRKKQYQACIHSLDKVLTQPAAPTFLHLIKASCLLELDQSDAAYAVYRDYFQSVPPDEWSSPEYWSAQENAIVLALENKDFTLAQRIADHMPESDEAHPNAAAQKKRYQKLCRQGLNQ